MAVVDSADLSVQQPKPGWHGRFFHSDRMLFAYYDIDAGADPVHEHHHEQEEVWHVLEGRIALTIEGTEHLLGPGMAGVVPAEALHAARPLEACRLIVVDTPLRDQVGAARVR
jgi:mannose-6-phosphate isomerase-like protein (cupin superfamily)